MNEVAACPDQATLERVLLGRLPGDTAAAIEAHIEGCSACVEALRTITARDDLLAALRQPADAAGSAGIDTQAARQLITRLCQLAPADFAHLWRPPSPGDMPTTAGGYDPTLSYRPDPDRTAVHVPVLAFLVPPQASDELGRLGPYRVLRALGAGGMGMVFLAEDTQLQRLVALKVLQTASADDPGSRERFLREARAAAAVRHENVVTIYQVGEVGNVPFLAMEFLEGEDLEARLKREGPLPIAEVVRIGREACTGLAAAHARGLLHRDIKPGNLWLEGQGGRVKILDFGLARQASAASELTHSGMVVGTPAYMAPEQAGGKSLDGRADLFSLGCVLYRACTGVAPFSGPTTMAVLLAVATRKPPAPRDVRPDVPAGLSDLIMRLLDKEPEGRPASAAETAVELEGCGRTNGRASSAGVAASKRRTRRAWAAAALLVLFAMLGAVAIVRMRGKTGEWVLEQYDRDVKVVVRQGTKVVDELEIEHGSDGNVRLAVGNYQVDVIGQSDQVTIESGVVKVERDGRVVARLMKAGVATVEQRAEIKPQAGNSPYAVDPLPADAPPPAIAPFDAAQAKAHQEAWAAHLKLPVEWTNGIGMKFRLIPPGEFMMGSTPEEIADSLQFVEETYRNNPDLMTRLSRWIRASGPQHRVVLTRPFYLAVHEATQSQYRAVLATNPAMFSATGNQPELREIVAGLDTSNFPVEFITWIDAARLCEKLSQRESIEPCYFTSPDAVSELQGNGYRLPTEAEWEFACRAGTSTRYWFGDNEVAASQSGWFGLNAGGRPHPVGTLNANPFGLHDVFGNVSEWCADLFDDDGYRHAADPAVDSRGAAPGRDDVRVHRGGEWSRGSYGSSSSARGAIRQNYLDDRLGCRLAISVEGARAVLEAQRGQVGRPPKGPPPAIAPFDAAQAAAHQVAWAAHLDLPVEWTNSIGMEFRLIPPGEFLMGSTPEEIADALSGLEHQQKNNASSANPKTPEILERDRKNVRSGGPQHRVVLTQPFYLAAYETTQSEYADVMGENPSSFAATGANAEQRDKVVGLDTSRFPVDGLSWVAAARFCEALSKRDELAPSYFCSGDTVSEMKGIGYRLPTEAEWEFACRAGTITRCWNGDRKDSAIESGWAAANSSRRTHAVGEVRANPFGLYDTHGNVSEWCWDYWGPDYYQGLPNPAIDPRGAQPAEEPVRVHRGGDYHRGPYGCSSSSRTQQVSLFGGDRNGCRLALSVEGVRKALGRQASPIAPD